MLDFFEGKIEFPSRRVMRPRFGGASIKNLIKRNFDSRSRAGNIVFGVEQDEMRNSDRFNTTN